MRETTKQVTLTIDGKEKQYLIKKMNALDGSGLLKFCAEKLLPAYKQLQAVFSGDEITDELSEEELAAIEQKRTEGLMSTVLDALQNLSKKELIDFEVECLNTVQVNLQGSWLPVMKGKIFCDTDLEYDVSGVLSLVFEVLIFNLRGFFGEGSLASLLGKLNSSQPNA